MKEKLIQCCKQLRLSANLAENAITAKGQTNQEYLLEILNAEIDLRNIKRRNLYLKKAGFDNVKTFQNYDFEDIKLPNGMTSDLLKQAEFLTRQENLILYRIHPKQARGNKSNSVHNGSPQRDSRSRERASRARESAGVAGTTVTAFCDCARAAASVTT